MKKVFFALLLLIPTLTLTAKAAPNPADYPVVVHVRSSSLSRAASPLSFMSLHLVAVIDAKTYELDTLGGEFYLLRVGDYKAKIVQNDAHKDYEYHRVYEFLFPDGKTRKFTVVGEE
jgi:hypothetical protein